MAARRSPRTLVLVVLAGLVLLYVARLARYAGPTMETTKTSSWSSWSSPSPSSSQSAEWWSSESLLPIPFRRSSQRITVPGPVQVFQLPPADASTVTVTATGTATAAAAAADDDDDATTTADVTQNTSATCLLIRRRADTDVVAADSYTTEAPNVTELRFAALRAQYDTPQLRAMLPAMLHSHTFAYGRQLRRVVPVRHVCGGAARASHVYVTDLVLVPTARQLFVFFVEPNAFFSQRQAVNWTGSTPIELVENPCAVLGALAIVLDDERDDDLLDGNGDDGGNGNGDATHVNSDATPTSTPPRLLWTSGAPLRIAHTEGNEQHATCRYALSDAFAEAVRRRFARGERELRLFNTRVLGAHRFFSIDLHTRSAGLLRSSTRASLDLGVAEAWMPPRDPGIVVDGDGDGGTLLGAPRAPMSLCIGQAVFDTPYAFDVFAFHRLTGIEHVYVGVGSLDGSHTSTQRVFDGLARRLHPFIVAGFVTLVRMSYPSLSTGFPQQFFALACNPALAHAKQHHDAFMGVWDFDELLHLTHAQLVDTPRPSASTSRAAEMRVTDRQLARVPGELLLATIRGGRAANALTSPPAKHAPDSSLASLRFRPPPHQHRASRRLFDWCEAVFATRLACCGGDECAPAALPTTREDGVPLLPVQLARPGHLPSWPMLHRRFAERTATYGWSGPGKRYTKSALVVHNAHSTSVHEMSNCQLGDTLHRRAAPPDARLIVDPASLALLHFESMYNNSTPKCGNNAPWDGEPSEFARVMNREFGDGSVDARRRFASVHLGLDAHDLDMVG